MDTHDYRIEPADYQADLTDLRTVREAVFVEEQNIPAEIEFDEIDPHCHHVIARNAFHQPIGTGRLTPERNIGRMAVLPEWRMRGVGKALLQALTDQAKARGWSEIGAQAQVAVKDFYGKFGFIQTGEEFIEAGIPHQAMYLRLQPSMTFSRASLKERGPSVRAVEFTTLEEALNAAAEIILQAGRQLCIYTPDLEPDLYGRKDITEALKHFAIRNRDGCAQFLIQNPTAARNGPHPLVSLAQRLPSSFSFRMPVEPEDIQYPSAFLASDRDGYLFRPFGDRYKGHWSPALPERKKHLFEAFDRMWQRSLPCPEFRTLNL